MTMPVQCGIIIFREGDPVVESSKKRTGEIMKKAILFAVAAVAAVVVTGCGSARTPTSGARANNVFYHTFFGISLESAVYGDGLIVNQK